MTELEARFNKIVDTFFHLPTLITIALVGVVLVWKLYDIGLDFGEGFVRLNTNQGNISLYWLNGCCQLDW